MARITIDYHFGSDKDLGRACEVLRTIEAIPEVRAAVMHLELHDGCVDTDPRGGGNG